MLMERVSCVSALRFASGKVSSQQELRAMSVPITNCSRANDDNAIDDGFAMDLKE
ncbi:MAG TPA: hypothetical protein VN367_10175 [Chlorobaculum sp.]|nr:hypothetical protein [Chlorobaculum sp.]